MNNLLMYMLIRDGVITPADALVCMLIVFVAAVVVAWFVTRK